MTRLSKLLGTVLIAPFLALAQSSNNVDLFNYLMPDAQFIAGIHVDAAKNSTFGQYVLSQLPAQSSFLNEFISHTGIDPRSDLTEIIIGWNGAAKDNRHWIVAARGTLGAALPTLEANATQHGAVITHMGDVDIISDESTKSGGTDVCVALFTDGFTDLAGDCTSVHAAIEFSSTAPGAGSAFALQAQQLRAKQDLWLASMVPIAQFAAQLGGGSAQGSSNQNPFLHNNLIQGIQQITGGVKFTAGAQPGAQLNGDVTMDSAQSATSLTNVINFLASLLKSNTQGGSSVAFLTLLENLTVTPQGNIVSLSLSVPETTLEQLFQQLDMLHTVAENRAK